MVVSFDDYRVSDALKERGKVQDNTKELVFLETFQGFALRLMFEFTRQEMGRDTLTVINRRKPIFSEKNKKGKL